MDQNVKLAQNQENGTLDQTSAFVLHQRQYGMEINVFVIRICLVTIVCHVQLQEHGISQRILVSVQLQKQFGQAQIANVRPAFMETTVFHVQLLDTGTQIKSNVSVKIHWYGTALTVPVLNHTSCTKETV